MNFSFGAFTKIQMFEDMKNNNKNYVSGKQTRNPLGECHWQTSPWPEQNQRPEEEIQGPELLSPNTIVVPKRKMCVFNYQVLKINTYIF
jgi:hypothetical protein